MKNKIFFVKQVSSLLFVFLVAIMSSSMLQAKESIKDGLQRCALTTNSSARLACYDLLSGRDNKLTPSVIETPALPLKKVEIDPPLPADKPKAELETQVLRITKCTRSGGNDKYTFYLDDGQVWKQVSHKRMKFDDCDLEVSIHKDFFGFKMQVEGAKKKFRVSRVR
jgi:hypothetical protein